MSKKEEAKPAKAYELMQKLLKGESKTEGSKK
jgi:hypothetical protein